MKIASYFITFGERLWGMAPATYLVCAVIPTQHYTLLRVLKLVCRLLVNLALAYLLDSCFVRQITKDILLVTPLSSAADSRLWKYLRDANFDSGETLYSFRSGSALTLAFSASPLAEVVSRWQVKFQNSFVLPQVSWRYQGWGPSWPTCLCSFAVSGGLSHLWRLQRLKGFCLQLIFIQVCSSTLIFPLSDGFL